MEAFTRVADIGELNGEALKAATHGRFAEAYQSFMAAENLYHAADPADPEVIMAGSDTLRDWGMTYARDASKIEIPDGLPEAEKVKRLEKRGQLFDAAEQVIDQAKRVATPLVTNSSIYANKRQLRRGHNIFWVAESVATRARTLRKVVLMDGPWGDDPGYGAAYAGLKPSYWAVTSAAQPLRYIRAKAMAAGENIHNSKSTPLHATVWGGRTLLRLAQTMVARHEALHDKVQSLKHVGRIAVSLRSKDAARKSIVAHP